jgi:hypothetical protein
LHKQTNSPTIGNAGMSPHFSETASVQSALKEEGQPKLATLFAFGCEPVTICAVGTILPVATVSPFLSADETFRVK